VFNGSTIGAVVVCALTFNMKRAAAPGNVLLKKGEENLKKASVANITQLVTVDKADLIERIGTLSPPRVREIVAGIRLLIEPRDLPRQ
jgi:mRNA interferase MazF